MRRHGFTLIELLVVVAIIALLVGLLLPSLTSARDVARDVRSLSNVRQMLIGYGMYQMDHHGHVLFGYTPPTVNGQAVVAFSPDGNLVGAPVSSRYPWRLAPYVADMWAILHSHPDTPPDDYYTRSLSPTYGINGIYVGGSTLYGQGFVNGDRPNYAARHLVFRNTDVHRAAQLIVFTDAKLRNFGGFGGDDTGFHLAVAPRAGGQRWTLDAEGRTREIQNYEVMGLPQGYYTQRIVTGFFDSHVQAMDPAALHDMRLWANKADATDYDPF